MIRIRSGDRTIELAWDGAPVPVSHLLEQAGLHPDHPCGGRGRCGKCRVLARGGLSPTAPEERKHLTAAELDAGMRKQFTEKFEEIRKEFDRVFRQLFGGGKGTLSSRRTRMYSRQVSASFPSRRERNCRI